MSPEYITLLVLVGVVILLITEWVPLAVTGMLIPVVLVLLGVLNLDEAFLRLIDPIIFIVTAAFVLGDAMFKVGIADKIGTGVADLNRKYGRGDKSIVLIIMVVSAAMSTILPNLGVAAALIPIVIAVASFTGVSRSKLLMALALASSLGGSITLIGTPTNLMARGAMEASEVGTFGFFDFAYVGLPLAVIGILYVAFIGIRSLPNRYVETPAASVSEKKENKQYSRFQQVTAIVLFVIFIIGIIFENQIGVPAHITSIICIIVVILFKVMSEKQVYDSISWSTTFFIVGMLTLADAIVKSGASNLIANGAISLFGENPNPYILIGGVFLLSTILTQFMSNTATAGMLAPIVISIAQGIDADPRAIVMAVAVGASCAFMTPIGTPANTMVMIPGKLKFTDWLRVGTPLVIIGLILVVVILPIVWPMN